MGDITLARLPEFLDRWAVPYDLVPGWETRGRASGGLAAMRGISVHHSAGATNGTLPQAIRYATVTAKDKPIGNGTISRTKDGPKLVLWAGLASNTAGKGGPRLSSRGLIPLDSANAVTVAWEAENNGVGEVWPDEMCDLYVRACCATIEWANACTPGAPLGPGDVFAHFEWTTRKIDPWGPSRFTDGQNKQWNMDRFRGEIFLHLIAGPAGATPPPPAEPVNAPTYRVQNGDGWWTVSRALGFSIAELKATNPGKDVLHPGDIVHAPASSPAVPQPPDPTPVDPCNLPGPLTPGAQGEDVKRLQRFLASNNWYPYAVDGDYGLRTEHGVQALQQYVRSVGGDPGPVDGVFGARTRAATCPLV